MQTPPQGLGAGELGMEGPLAQRVQQGSVGVVHADVDECSVLLAHAYTVLHDAKFCQESCGAGRIKVGCPSTQWQNDSHPNSANGEGAGLHAAWARPRKGLPRLAELCGSGCEKVTPAIPMREEGGRLSMRMLLSNEVSLPQKVDRSKPHRSRLTGLSPATKRPRGRAAPSSRLTADAWLGRQVSTTVHRGERSRRRRSQHQATERVIDPAVTQRPGVNTLPQKQWKTGPSLKVRPEAQPTPWLIRSSSFSTNPLSLHFLPLALPRVTTKGEGCIYSTSACFPGPPRTDGYLPGGVGVGAPWAGRLFLRGAGW